MKFTQHLCSNFYYQITSLILINLYILSSSSSYRAHSHKTCQQCPLYKSMLQYVFTKKFTWHWFSFYRQQQADVCKSVQRSGQHRSWGRGNLHLSSDRVLELYTTQRETQRCLEDLKLSVPFTLGLLSKLFEGKQNCRRLTSVWEKSEVWLRGNTENQNWEIHRSLNVLFVIVCKYYLQMSWEPQTSHTTLQTKTLIM